MGFANRELFAHPIWKFIQRASLRGGRGTTASVTVFGARGYVKEQGRYVGFITRIGAPNF